MRSGAEATLPLTYLFDLRKKKGRKRFVKETLSVREAHLSSEEEREEEIKAASLLGEKLFLFHTQI